MMMMMMKQEDQEEDIKDTFLPSSSTKHKRSRLDRATEKEVSLALTPKTSLKSLERQIEENKKFQENYSHSIRISLDRNMWSMYENNSENNINHNI